MCCHDYKYNIAKGAYSIYCYSAGGLTKDMCIPEDRYLTCANGAKLTIVRASFGRMRSSKCMSPNLGYVHCQKDITVEVSNLCNSKPGCDVMPLVTQLYRQDLPCPDDLPMYIEATYTCREGSAVT